MAITLVLGRDRAKGPSRGGATGRDPRACSARRPGRTPCHRTHRRTASECSGREHRRDADVGFASTTCCCSAPCCWSRPSPPPSSSTGGTRSTSDCSPPSCSGSAFLGPAAGQPPGPPRRRDLLRHRPARRFRRAVADRRGVPLGVAEPAGPGAGEDRRRHGHLRDELRGPPARGQSEPRGRLGAVRAGAVGDPGRRTGRRVDPAGPVRAVSEKNRKHSRNPARTSALTGLDQTGEIPQTSGLSLA